MILALLAAMAACGGDDETSADLEALDPQAVLAESAEAMHALIGARFELARSGAPVYIDTSGVLAYETASGRYSAPRSADALITVTAVGITTEVGAIAVDGVTWLTNPVSGEWELLPESLQFDPTVLFDPEQGWRPLLTTDMSDVAFVDDPTLADGVVRIRGTAAADRLEVITAGLVTDQATEIDLWIDTDRRVIRAEFSSELDGEVSDWVMTFSDFGQSFVIEPPDVG